MTANQTLCLFHAADTRSHGELEQLLGIEDSGVLSSDDFSVYNGYRAVVQQKCLAPEGVTSQVKALRKEELSSLW